MANTIDLTNCDREPIHIPGSIQPHGALLVLNTQFIVVQASQNAGALLGETAVPVVGAALDALINRDDAVEIRRRVMDGTLQVHPVYAGVVRSQAGGEFFDAIVHATGGRVVLELEPSPSSQPSGPDDLYRMVQTAIVKLRSARTTAETLHVIAKCVREITGFDRVMVYRFDDEWNGEVVAEERREELEPFLGLHYPASDIPKQARELYRKNWLRFIADRDYLASPILPEADPDSGQPLDMSFCVLRSVSPIHIEYLRNMQVGASMSISLVRDNQLWGLVACHHYSPRRVPFSVRTACELLGQVMSLEAAARERAELEADVRSKSDRIERIIERMDVGERFAQSLVHSGDDLLHLMNCGGAAVVVENEVTRIGQTPGEADILNLARRLRESGHELYASDDVRSFIGQAKMDPVASGLLAISLTRYGHRSVMWFRPEQIRTVNWAGDPAKSIVKGDGDDVRLSPRGSFALWKQTVSGRSVAWTAAEEAAALQFRQAMLAKLLAYTDAVDLHNRTLRRARDEKEQQLETERAARSEAERINRMKDEFVATLSHELRTPLTAIQGWAQILRAPRRSQVDMKEGLEIIERNARAQTQMVEDLLDVSRITSGKLRLDVQTVNLPTVVEAAITTVQVAASIKDIRIQKVLDQMSGVAVTGDPHRLQQVFWNLLSNAVKFTPKGGRIRVELKRVNSHVEVTINDSGEGIPAGFLPHVFDRFRQADATYARKHGGLGLGLAIVRNLVEMHGGTVSADSAGIGKGATFTVTLPVRAVNTEGASDSTLPDETADDECVKLTGISALVVDDAPDTRELVRLVLDECAVKVETAASCAEAIGKLRDGKFDILISDIGMPEQDGYQLVRLLREHEQRNNLPKMPAIALTAYARAEDRRKIMLAGFQMHIAKPVEPSELIAVVASLVGRV
ncbi:MAG: ATP-binding protein [Tepidisphaeraceae bacterium]